MSLSRRSFFAATCVAVGGVSLLPTERLEAAAVATGARKALTAPLPMSTTEAALVSFLRSYSPSVRLVGSGVLAKLRNLAPDSLHYLVQAPDLGALTQALSGPLPFFGEQRPTVFASGNSLTFTLEGVAYEIENATAEEYERRMTNLLRPIELAFVQDGLSYEPGSLVVSDPFAAAQRPKLTLINSTPTAAAALAVTLRAARESRALGLTVPPEFAAWHVRSLNLLARAKDAAAIAGTLLRAIAGFGDELAPQTVAALLLTKTVSSAFAQFNGLEVKTAISKYSRLRPKLDGSVLNSSLWLALLLAPALGAGGDVSTADASFDWVQGGTPEQNARSHDALAKARLAYALPALQNA